MHLRERNKRWLGFNMIEVLVGFVVLVIALLGMAGLTQRYFVLNQSTTRQKEAAEIARNLYLQLKAMKFAPADCNSTLTMTLQEAQNCSWLVDSGVVSSDRVTPKFPPKVNNSNCSSEGIILSSMASTWGNFDVVAANGLVVRKFSPSLSFCDLGSQPLSSKEYIRYYRTYGSDDVVQNEVIYTAVVLWRTRDGAWRHTAISSHPVE